MKINCLNKKKSSNIQLNKGPIKLTLFSIFCAVTICVSYLESIIPILPILPPGAKPGFANIVTMFICSCFGLYPAIIIVIIKSVFVAITRGAIAFLMSFFGGIFSTLITGLLIRLIPYKFNYIYIGIIGALTHNLVQLIVAYFIIGNIVFYYLPFLVLFAIIAGSVTGLILNILLPVLIFL